VVGFSLNIDIFLPFVGLRVYCERSAVCPTARKCQQAPYFKCFGGDWRLVTALVFKSNLADSVHLPNNAANTLFPVLFVALLSSGCAVYKCVEMGLVGCHDTRFPTSVQARQEPAREVDVGHGWRLRRFADHGCVFGGLDRFGFINRMPK
jgi:hypothetical protein